MEGSSQETFTRIESENDEEITLSGRRLIPEDPYYDETQKKKHYGE